MILLMMAVAHRNLQKRPLRPFTGDDFWGFVERLATGRKLVITGDHGYANVGLFRDLVDKEQIDYMKKLFKSGRSTTNCPESNHNWVPPLSIEMEGQSLALGRRKWKSQGGYPTLTHGGLSLLEVAVPFIEIEKRRKITAMSGAKLTKLEKINRMVAAVVNAGEERHLETVDFNDPNRPKTCLEVDFPILPINQIAQIEGNAGKPIYQMSKWWARRRSSVFRSILIAAAAKAPKDQMEAAKLVWANYYCNHQKNSSFKKLKVADIFMGGGTTLVEGARLRGCRCTETT